MNSLLISTVISVGGLVVGFIRLSYQIKKDKEEQYNHLSVSFETQFKKHDEENKCSIKEMNDRINQLESYNGRLSAIEGELKGIRNLVNLVVESFVKGVGNEKLPF